MSSVVCVGCAKAIPNTTDRRNICNKSADAVAALWRDFLNRELEEKNQLAFAGSLFSDKGAVCTKDDGYQRNMCRKCYYMYDKMKVTRYCNIG